jgi:hypothetical protein
MKMHFSVNEIDFEIFVKVLGFAYVFENGEKCNCVDVRVFVCVFVCVLFRYCQKKRAAFHPWQRV